MVTASFLFVLVFFTLVPPYNTDSSGYHFLSILWNEKYKAVPGVANLFPQYGYNSSFFVLSAAFSFTTVFKQSVYPVNSILVTFFFLWLLKKSFYFNDVRKILIWFLLIICLRQFPINLASPSADALASILVFYILFEVMDKQRKMWKPGEWTVLILLAFFAIIIKLSTLPLVLVALVPFVVYRKNLRAVFSSYGKIIPVVLIILAPWLVRNVILSGYLIFPFSDLNLFSFDWKVPEQVAIIERLHISNAPKMISDDWKSVSRLPLYSWLPQWLPQMWSDSKINFSLIAAALASPAAVLVLYVKKKMGLNNCLPWFIAYAGAWFWIATSPDIRFGFHYLFPCIFFPLLAAGKGVEVKQHLLFNVVVLLVCLYYDYMAIYMLKPYSFSFVLRPLKSPEYYKNNDKLSFRYVLLNNETKLYIQDSTHHSINAPLPVCYPYRAGIEMRGNKLEDGFKTQP